MKNKFLLALTLGVATCGVMAQSKFDGAYGQVGIGYEGITPSISNSSVVVTDNVGTSQQPVSLSANNSNSFTGLISAGYMKSVNQSFLLGFGVDFSPIKGRNTNYSVSSGPVAVVGNYNKEYYYNIFISPAAPIGSEGLIYGKFGYTGAMIKDVIAGSSSNTNFSGLSLGLGYKQIIEGGLYGFVEGNYLLYGSRTFSDSDTVNGNTVAVSFTSRADAYNLLLGIGYKF